MHQPCLCHVVTELNFLETKFEMGFGTCIQGCLVPIISRELRLVEHRPVNLFFFLPSLERQHYTFSLSRNQRFISQGIEDKYTETDLMVCCYIILQVLVLCGQASGQAKGTRAGR